MLCEKKAKQKTAVCIIPATWFCLTKYGVPWLQLHQDRAGHTPRWSASLFELRGVAPGVRSQDNPQAAGSKRIS